MRSGKKFLPEAIQEVTVTKERDVTVIDRNAMASCAGK